MTNQTFFLCLLVVVVIIGFSEGKQLYVSVTLIMSTQFSSVSDFFFRQGVICRENLQKINIIICCYLVQYYQIMRTIIAN